MKQRELFLIIQIAKQAGLHGKLNTSTSKLAMLSNISQQSVSRKLIQLEKQGFIERKPRVSGISVSLTEKGIAELKEHFRQLESIFLPKKSGKFSFSGKVVSGLGEGKYYLSFRQYAEQFEKKFSFTPFPGTLNVKTNPEQAEKFVLQLVPEYIMGFQTKERSFGGLTAYRIKINNKIACCLIVPDRTHHSKEEIEIVAPVYLRKALKLKDGSRVGIQGE